MKKQQLSVTVYLLMVCLLVLPTTSVATESNPGIATQDFSRTLLYRAQRSFGATIDRSNIHSTITSETDEMVTVRWGAYLIEAEKAGHAKILSITIDADYPDLFEKVKPFDIYKDKKESDFLTRAALIISVLENDLPSSYEELTKTGKVIAVDSQAKLKAMMSIFEEKQKEIAGKMIIPCYEGVKYNYYWYCNRPMYIPLFDLERELYFVAKLKQ